MAVRASIAHFPLDAEAVKQCGIPWGVSVTPFSATDEHGSPPALGPEGHLLPRCESCWAYFNPFCELDQWSWSCALCGSSNGLTAHAISRYSRPESCAELSSLFVDLEIPGDGSEGEVAQPRPVYVAAVDLNSSEEFLELVRSALQAALEALPPGSLFGLVTFSHKIGLYDIQGPIAVVKNVFISPDSDGQLPIPLEDVMPLLSFLAPVDNYKDQITAALDTLKPTNYWEKATPTEQGSDGVLLSGRGFGAAMEAVISYLASDHGNTYALARVFAFLSGPPDYGPGQIDTTRYGEQYASKRVDADLALLTEQTPFYKDLAALAVQAGASVDIYAVTNEYTDLASLKFLCIDSGGSLFLYVNTDDSTLPQDIYRMLSRPYAFGCLLRLRTSSEFKSGNSYGHFAPDPQYDNVQHIICCDSFGTFAYDFEFTSTTGFSRYRDPPFVQIAFQYSVIVPNEDSDQDRSRYSLKRRLRVRTLQLKMAQRVNDLYNSVDPDVVLSILVHKIILASLEQGVKEGRLLLQDWLTILLSQYNEAYKVENSSIDVTFSQCPQLQSLPRLVFALLRSPLLRFHEEGVHPDHRIFLQCLYSSLEPAALQCAIYPVLTSYETPDKQAYPRHSLSRAALVTSGSPIYFLDAFTHLIVYYSSTADPSFPFPPPHDCLLRTRINRLKKERTLTPRLTFIRGGHSDATAFENYLIEDKPADGSGPSAVMGFVGFLEELTRDVAEYIK